MQTTKMNTQSKKRGKNANRKTAVPDIAGQEARDAARAEIPEEAPIESQKTADEECPFIDQPAVHPETDVRLLDLNKIVNSTYNPRKNFREETLLELAESIKQSGVLQPICVRPRDEGFEIVYGERRYWGAAMAGLKFIPALVRNLSDAEAEDAAITENLQREDMNCFETAAGLRIAGAPLGGTERAQRGRGMEGTGTDLGVIGLHNDAALLAPVLLEAQDDVLEGKR